MLNRPYAILQYLSHHAANMTEEYILMSEPDHLLLKPPPNWATPNTAAAFYFHYMGKIPKQNATNTRHRLSLPLSPLSLSLPLPLSPSLCVSVHATVYIYRRYHTHTDNCPIDVRNNAMHEPLVDRFNRKGAPYGKIFATGNAPVIMSKIRLADVAPTWHALALEINAYQPSKEYWGWVLEMWAFTIACAQQDPPIEFEMVRTPPSPSLSPSPSLPLSLSPSPSLPPSLNE